MDEILSWGERALEGAARVREKNHELRGRAGTLLLLLRGAYFTGENKWRALAEEDLRALWRSGAHDHIGGGFFSGSRDREWLRPVFEKRLDDNAVLAYFYTEAWQSGRMAFYRAAAEEALDFCLRELAAPSGLCCAGQYAAHPEAEDNPYLFTPAQVCGLLGEEAGRHFAECYDVTAEGNCGAGSIPNLILNQRWSFVPEGYDDFREILRLAREERGGIVTDTRTPLAANALLLAALARAGRVFEERRYLAAAEELCAALAAAERLAGPEERAARAFARLELYAADFDPAQLAAAAQEAAALPTAPKNDRALALAALCFDALLSLTGDGRWRTRRGETLRELCLHADRHGPESVSGLCALLSAAHTSRRVLCVSPTEEIPPALAALGARYAPDLRLLLKTPARTEALAASVPDSASFEIGNNILFYPCFDGIWGSPTGF